MKPIFNLKDYPGRVVMHCPEEWMAEKFCHFLDTNGRTWCGKEPYVGHTNWDNYRGDTCYYFNDGTYTDIEFFKEGGYKILEFSDFSWVTIRPTKDAYYLNFAKVASQRSTCNRRQYGAVIVKNDKIISTGYNGSARGEVNCCDTGTCWREAHGIPHGQQYEKCQAVHAEVNALLQAGREAEGATLYLAGFEHGKLIKAEPCEMCRRAIKNAGIARVVGTEAEE